MATPIPPGLKAAEISRFALRASQLEKAKPIVAYYCNYWTVNQILARGLHNADEECVAYTTHLMDKLEQFKAENQDNDAVTDDLAGRAYVEQFGLETFQRADNAVRANKASRQTADTFSASATFLELLQIWGELEQDNTAKIKYAKYHALRIAKALKAGEDPNLSNPPPEPEPSADNAMPPLEEGDVEMVNGASSKSQQPSAVEVPDESDRLQKTLAQRSSLGESLHPSRDSSIPRPANAAPRPSVQEVPDETDRLQSKLARQSALDESLHPSRAPSIPRQAQVNEAPPHILQEPSSFYSRSGAEPDVSPITDPFLTDPTSDRRSSFGGNYFPHVPSPLAQAPPSTAIFKVSSDISSRLNLPSAPAEHSLPDPPATFSPPPQQQEPTQMHHAPPYPPQQHHGHFIPPTSTIPPSMDPQPQPRQQIPHAPSQLYHPTPESQYPQAYSQPPHPPAAAPQIYSPSAPLRIPAPQPVAPPAVVNEEAVMKAQKHARWAISALNFEDVPTAIRELREALENLGAR